MLLAAPGTALAGLIDETAYTQPALYALQTGLWSLWRSWGLEATATLGHSVGEFAAAHAAGVLSLEDGARLVARRGALMGALPAGGAMAVVFASSEAVAAALARANGGGSGPGVSLAAENGTHRVVSGPAGLVDALVAEFTAAGARCQRLTVSHAFHSALLDPMLDELETAAGAVEHREASLGLVSNLTGAAFASGTRPDAAYWRRHARSPVLYAAGVAALAEMGVDVLLELGPRPVLGPLALGCWPGAAPPVALSSLRPGVMDERALAEAVAGLYAAGESIDFARREAGRGRRRIGLPGYPFERTRHWVEAPKSRGLRASNRPMLGAEHRLANGEASWTQELSAAEPGWLGDYRVFGSAVLPGAVHACMAAAAQSGPASLRDGTIHAPLVLTDEPVEVQLLLSAPDDAGDQGWQVFARAAGSAASTPWRLYASGRVGAVGATPEAPALSLLGLKERDVNAFYAEMASLGFGYGPSFQRVERLWSGAGMARGEIAAPEGLMGEGSGLHPAVLDGCFQMLLAALPEATTTGDPYVPLSWESLELWEAVPHRIVCEAQLRKSSSSDMAVADLWLRDGSGAVFGRLRGLLMKRTTRQALLGAAAGVEELLYEMVWRETPLPTSTAEFLAKPADIAARVASRLGPLTLAAGFEADREARQEALLERFAWGYALSSLRDLGWSPKLDDVVEASALRTRLGVTPDNARLFGRLLSMLAEAGILAPNGNRGTMAGERRTVTVSALGGRRGGTEQIDRLDTAVALWQIFGGCVARRDGAATAFIPRGGLGSSEPISRRADKPDVEHGVGGRGRTGDRATAARPKAANSGSGRRDGRNYSSSTASAAARSHGLRLHRRLGRVLYGSGGEVSRVPIRSCPTGFWISRTTRVSRASMREATIS